MEYEAKRRYLRYMYRVTLVQVLTSVNKYYINPHDNELHGTWEALSC